MALQSLLVPIVFFIALFFIVLGRVLLRAIEAVVSSRRTRERTALSHAMLFGWILIVLGLCPVLGLLVAAGLQVLFAGQIFMNVAEWAVATGLATPLLVVSLAGGLLILIAQDLETGFVPDKRLDGLMVLGWFFTIAGIVMLTAGFVVPIVIGIAIVASRRRKSDQNALLWVLAMAAHRKMPLARSVAVFVDQCRGRYRRQVLSFAEMLESGVPLPEALDRLPGVLPEAAHVAARLGWENGVLGPALREAAVARTFQQPAWHAVAGRLLYLFVLLLIMQTIVGFVLYFIIPKFKKIFMDFGVELPQITLIVLSVADWVVEYFYLLVILFMVFLLYLVFLGLGWLRWRPGFVDKLLIRTDTARILRALAITVDAGQPLTAGFKTLALTYPRDWIRARLERVQMKVSGGMDWCESLRREGLIPGADAAVLAAAQRAGNLAWALREMAESGERRLGYKLQAWTQILFPVAVLCAGALVFFIVAGIFSPLIKLISELSG